MSLLGAFLGHEARIQLRSLRFRALAGAYVVLSVAPPVLLHYGRLQELVWIGAASYAATAYLAQPLLTALLSAVVAVDAVTREREEGSLSVVGLAPLTSAGYLLRRWLAVEALVLPLTLVGPLAAALLATLAGVAPRDPGPFVWPWLLHVAPLSLTASALALGLGTIAGGVVLATIAGLFGFRLVLGLGNDLLARAGRNIGGVGDWIGLDAMAVFSPGGLTSESVLGLVTEAPYDARAAASAYAVRGALAMGLAALALGAAGRFLQRTRRDLRPWRIRGDHPLRTFLAWLNRMRQDHAPEPAPSASDRLVLGAGLLVFLAAASYPLPRAERYRAMAEERLRVERKGGPEPTPAGLVPGPWRIEGEIHGNGRVTTEVTASMRNETADPVAHAAFSLNPFLHVVRAQADRGEIVLDAAWDRVSVELDPPIPPHGERKLSFRLEGRPAQVEFACDEWPSFVASYGHFRQARVASDLVDLSRSRTVPAISPRRVSLDATDLSPVPRYRPWTLAPPAPLLGRAGRNVPAETWFPPSELAVDVRAPAGIFLADACGSIAGAEAGRTRLTGVCRIALANYVVRGGNLVRLADTPGIGAVAVLPAHLAAARFHVPGLALVAELASKAGAGLVTEPTRNHVILEWPPAFDTDPTEGMRYGWNQVPSRLPVLGRLHLLAESLWLVRSPLAAQELAASALASELASRRPVAAEQRLLFRHLFLAVALARVGGRDRGATIVERTHEATRADLRQPLLEADPSDEVTWIKLEALLTDLEHRVGAQAFTDGLAVFLDGPVHPSGSLQELLESISHRSGRPLDRFYSDYVTGAALPVLSLEDVRARRAGREWDISGRVRNLGTGEAVCPVVLQTDLDMTGTQVTVGSSSAVPFAFKSPHHPRAVLLDPDERCYRFRPNSGAVERVVPDEEG